MYYRKYENGNDQCVVSAREMQQPVINSIPEILTECLCAENYVYHRKETEE